MTAEKLLRRNLPNKRTELVRGVLVLREPAMLDETGALRGEDVLPGSWGSCGEAMATRAWQGMRSGSGRPAVGSVPGVSLLPDRLAFLGC